MQEDIKDASFMRDPLAERTSWEPLRPGGASFRTHKLVPMDMVRLVFKPSLWMMGFNALFVILGVGVALIFWLEQQQQPEPFQNWLEWIPVGMGVFFFLLGLGMFYFSSIPLVFDRQRRLFWRGWREPAHAYNATGARGAIHFDQVHAIQLLKEIIRAKNGPYASYELNLVLKDGTRAGVVDHGDLERLREDAARLSRFIDRPVWDAIGMNENREIS